ncbi:hypothetical protein [Aliiruegeria sabulilitoris]|uniref:hypothetical protein n=1 Tax=Aliiruegeria sabulilitoris TaxID=1510458 RepID=UPI00082D0035|nr:hypothetical protein [Aliiruegeria sabulilitoris]NDR54983.1 pilus assembly protein PilP [Pseudoruegeria sp. M32A2M]
MSENTKVASAATQKNEIELDRLALIGTFGTDAERHALVRHSSGRIEKVKMGEKVAGRRIVAIGNGEMFLQTGSGTRKLEMPAG